MKVCGALGRHLEAKLEPKMASMCALAAQLGSTSPVESPSQVTSPIEGKLRKLRKPGPLVRLECTREGMIYIYIYIYL